MASFPAAGALEVDEIAGERKARAQRRERKLQGLKAIERGKTMGGNRGTTQFV